ncbi:MAG: TonB-dependent receptor [Bacteroidota bacterium]
MPGFEDHAGLCKHYTAYRPYLYASITPADQIGKIDPNLKDSRGYTSDIGYRGTLGSFLKFDVNYFYVFYGDKIGKLTEKNPDNSTYQLTTNIGNSVHQGVEAFVNLSLLKVLGGTSNTTDLSVFSSIAYTHARVYDRFARSSYRKHFDRWQYG